MPANLPVEAQKAQEDYEEAQTPADRLRTGERFLKAIPKHKGTSKLRAHLKQTLAKLRKELEAQKSRAKHRHSLHVKKQGPGQVCVVGFPNTGKSYLLNTICNTKLASSYIPFETSEPETGMANMEDIQLQMVEIPSFTENFRARQHGAELLSIIRNCDLILILVSRKGEAEEYDKIKNELEANGIVIERRRKEIKVTRKVAGGISIVGKELFKGKVSAIKSTLIKSGIHNAEVIFREEADIEDLVDSLDESIVYKESMVVSNLAELEKLVRDIWNKLGLLRVYTKRPGEKKTEEPLVIPKGSTIKDVGKEIHKDFIKNFRFARVFGSSAKFKGQMVGLNHKVADKDIVEFHLE
jgi:ribosome-interacting GTPase 1